jgi:hypothetical protein
MTAMPSYITARTSEKSNPAKFCMKEIIARNNLCRKKEEERGWKFYELFLAELVHLQL